MKLRLKLLLITAALAISGCATQRFDLSSIKSNTSPSFDDSQTFWVGGIGQSKELDAQSVCASKKVVSVETQLTAGDVGLSIITLFIYTPRHVRVTCGN